MFKLLKDAGLLVNLCLGERLTDLDSPCEEASFEVLDELKFSVFHISLSFFPAAFGLAV